MVAVSLEWLIANTHGVSMASIHEHTIVPEVVHALAMASIPVGLYPVVRSKSPVRLWIRATGGLAIAAFLIAGHTLTAGFLSCAFSAATLLWFTVRPRFP